MSTSCSSTSPGPELVGDGLDIVRLSAGGRRELAVSLDLPPYRGAQIAQWVFDRGVRDFDKMTDLPSGLRQDLTSKLGAIGLPIVATERGGGTTKHVLRLSGDDRIECVHMSHTWGRTACLSTQVGCPIGCVFCASGAEGLVRNLTAEEIAGQVLSADDGTPPPGHVVLMGSGEPLVNIENVLAALGMLCDGHVFAVPERNVTVSTIGSVRGIERLLDSGRRVRLALSVHAADPGLRAKLVPRELDPLADIVAAAREYATKTRRRPTFECVLLRGINDSAEHAGQLAALVGSGSHVNLIVYNSIPGGRHDAPDAACVARFEEVLTQRGVNVSVRRSAGTRLRAGCGQLRARAHSD